MRAPMRGTVAQEDPRDDAVATRGRDRSGWAKRVPVAVDASLVDRGEARFGVFCTPCHDKAGSGRGIVALRGFTRPIDLASENSRGLSDGEIFDIATNGVRTMPAHRWQIPALDRWAIVTWVRVLQRSQHASVDDLVAETVPTIEPEGATP
jgi:mono/diheme cytochrome c family protein